jgi:hypothetical protein
MLSFLIRAIQGLEAKIKFEDALMGVSLRPFIMDADDTVHKILMRRIKGLWLRILSNS